MEGARPYSVFPSAWVENGAFLGEGAQAQDTLPHILSGWHLPLRTHPGGGLVGSGGLLHADPALHGSHPADAGGFSWHPGVGHFFSSRVPGAGFSLDGSYSHWGGALLWPASGDGGGFGVEVKGRDGLEEPTLADSTCAIELLLAPPCARRRVSGSLYVTLLGVVCGGCSQLVHPYCTSLFSSCGLPFFTYKDHCA